MRDVTLSWSLSPGSYGERDAPAWVHVWRTLNELTSRGGTVRLEVTEEGDEAPRSLSVQAAEGHYLMTLGAIEDGDYRTRSFTNPQLGLGEVEIGGYFWHPGLVCTEFRTVLRAFQEFFETGDVSTDLLD